MPTIVASIPVSIQTQALAFLAVIVYATHATQAIAFEWKPGFTPWTSSWWFFFSLFSSQSSKLISPIVTIVNVTVHYNCYIQSRLEPISVTQSWSCVTFSKPNPTQNFWTQPNATHHRHLVWHIRLYRKLFTTTVTRHRQVLQANCQWKLLFSCSTH